MLFMSDCLHVGFDPLFLTIHLHRICVYFGNYSTSKLSSILPILMLKVSCCEFFLLEVEK